MEESNGPLQDSQQTCDERGNASAVAVPEIRPNDGHPDLYDSSTYHQDILFAPACPQLDGNQSCDQAQSIQIKADCQPHKLFISNENNCIVPMEASVNEFDYTVSSEFGVIQAEPIHEQSGETSTCQVQGFVIPSENNFTVPFETNVHEIDRTVPLESSGIQICGVHGPIVIQPEETHDGQTCDEQLSDHKQPLVIQPHENSIDSNDYDVTANGVNGPAGNTTPMETCTVKLEASEAGVTVALDTENVTLVNMEGNSVCDDTPRSAHSLCVKTEQIKLEPTSECEMDSLVPRLQNSTQSFGNVQVKTEEALSNIKCEDDTKECLLCGKIFQIRAKLEHYALQKESGGYQCTECDEYFPLKAYVLYHAHKQHHGAAVVQRGKCLNYICPICSCVMSPSRLDLHMRNHNILHYRCPENECGWMFDSEMNLQLHMKVHEQHPELMWDANAKDASHLCSECCAKAMTRIPENIPDLYKRNKRKDVKCPHCLKTFSNELWLTYHIASYQGASHVCKHCSKIFDTKQALQSHQVVHATKKRKYSYEILCGKCPRSFDSLAALKEHSKEHVLIQCADCGKDFRSEQHLERHQKYCTPNVKETKTTPEIPIQFACRMCPRNFSSRKLLDDHIAKHPKGTIAEDHGIDRNASSNVESEHHGAMKGTVYDYRNYLQEKPNGTFQCRECSEIFRIKYEVLYHAYSKHSALRKGNNDVHTCPACGREYTESYEFMQHISAHDKYPWKCQSCGWAYESCHEVITHMANKHKDAAAATITEMHSYSCPHCEMQFQDAAALDTHLKFNHPEIKRVRTCPVCSRKFLYQSLLDEHVNNHGKMTYKCSECGMAYVHQDSLDDHMRVYHRQFRCSKCEHVFGSTRSLNFHLVKKHLLSNDKLAKSGKMPERKGEVKCPKFKRTYPKLFKHMGSTNPPGEAETDVEQNTKDGPECTDSSSAPEKCPVRSQELQEKITQIHYMYTQELRGSVMERNDLLQCPMCTRMCPTASELLEHMDSLHSIEMMQAITEQKEEKGLKCPVCQKVRRNTLALLEHLRREHPNYCKTLNSGTAVSSETLHSGAAVLNESKHFVFNVDGTTAKSSSKKYRCSRCQTVFDEINAVYVHMKTSCAPKPDSCAQNTLKKYPMRSQELQEKIMQIHYMYTQELRGIIMENNGQVQCPMCERGYHTASELLEHIDSLHSIEMMQAINEQKEEKGLKCPVCDKVRRNTLALLEHLRREHPDDCKTRNKGTAAPNEKKHFVPNLQGGTTKPSSKNYGCSRRKTVFDEINAMYAHVKTTYTPEPESCDQNTSKASVHGNKKSAEVFDANVNIEKCNTNAPWIHALSEDGRVQNISLQLNASPSKSRQSMKFKCSRCRRVFEDLESLHIHYESLHPTNEQTLQKLGRIKSICAIPSDNASTENLIANITAGAQQIKTYMQLKPSVHQIKEESTPKLGRVKSIYAIRPENSAKYNMPNGCLENMLSTVKTGPRQTKSYLDQKPSSHSLHSPGAPNDKIAFMKPTKCACVKNHQCGLKAQMIFAVKCTQCPQMFTSKSLLQSHVICEHGLRPGQKVHLRNSQVIPEVPDSNEAEVTPRVKKRAPKSVKRLKTKEKPAEFRLGRPVVVLKRLPDSILKGLSNASVHVKVLQKTHASKSEAMRHIDN